MTTVGYERLPFGLIDSLRRAGPVSCGLLLILAAWGVQLASVPALAVALPLFVSYVNRFQIRPEEAALTRLYGDDYTAYLASTRRWL